MKKILTLLLILLGCSPSSLEDYQREGEALCRMIGLDLQKIHTKEELQKALPHLEKQFDKLVDLMIQARRFQQEHPEDVSFYEGVAGDALRLQLERVYGLEGGRDFIEQAQHEPLLKLDNFERNLLKQQSISNKKNK